MSERDNSKESHISIPLKLYVVSFLFPFIIVLIAFIIGGFAPFGGKDIFTVSGHTNVYEYLREGFIKSSSFYNIAYSFLIGCSGLFASVFFHKRKTYLTAKRENNEKRREEEIRLIAEKKAAKREKSKDKHDIKLGGTEAPRSKLGTIISNFEVISFIFAMCFALGAHMLSMGLNILYLPSITLLPLIMYGYDLLINENKYLTYVLASMLSIVANPYMMLVTFIFELLYGITLNYCDTKHMFKSYIRKIICDLIIVIFSVPFISNIHNGIVGTDKLSLSFPALIMSFNPFDLAKRFMFDALPSNVSSYANDLNLYFGIGALFLLVLYVFNRNIPSSDRLKNAIIFAVLTAGCNVTTLNYLFAGFKYTGDICGAFNFVYIFFALTLALEELVNIEHSTSLDMLISLIITGGMSIACIMFCENYDSVNPFIYTIQLIGIYFLICILWKNDSMTKLLFQTGFAAVLLFELSFNFIDDLGFLGLVGQSYADSSIGRLEATKEYIYESDEDANILYYEDLVTESNPFTNMILGITHVVAPEGSPHIDSLLEYSETVNGYDIYINPYALRNGVLLSKEAIEWSYAKEYPFSSFNIFSKNLLGGDEIFETISVSPDDIELSFDVLLDADLNLITNDKSLNLTLNKKVSGDIYATTTHSVHMGKADNTDSLSISHLVSPQTIDKTSIKGQFVRFNEENLISLYNELSKVKIAVNSSIIDVTAASDGYILIPKEYDENIRVDNNSINSIYIIDKEYILVPVTEGNNHIVMTVSHTNIIKAVIYMLICILLLAAFYLIKNNRKNISQEILEDVSSWAVSNKIYIYSIACTSTMFFLFVILARSLPFGSHSLITSDGFIQYYPWFTSLFEHVKSGDFSLLNFHGGLAMDNYLMYYTILFNPINWPMLFFPVSMSYIGFEFVYFLRFILTGPVIIFYLTNRPGKRMKKTDMRLLVLSLCFSFSTYFIGYLCYYLFFDMALMFPICLLYMEKMLYEKKIKGYIISLAVTMFFCNYLAFLMCEFLFLYFFVTKFDNIKDFFLKAVRFGLCSIFSVGIAAAGLLPFFIFTRQSSYGSSDIFPSFNLSNSLIASINTIQVVATPNVVTSDSTRANSYMGLLVILCVGLYLINNSIPLSIRIRKFLLAFLLYFAYGNDFLNFILHGFHMQSNVPNRFSIFFIFTMISMLYDTLINIKEISNKKGLITFISSSVLFAILATICYVQDVNYVHINLPSLLTYSYLFIYMLVAIVNHIKSPGKVYQHIFSFLLISEILITSLIAKYMTSEIYSSDFQSIDSIREITSADIDNNNIERAEYISNFENYSTSENIAYLVNTDSVSCFSSLMNDDIHNVLMASGTMRKGTNFIEYSQGDPFSSILLNAQYMYMSSYDINSIVPGYMDEIDFHDNIILYKNPYSLSLGFFIDNDNNVNNIYKESTNNNYKSLADYQNSLSKQLTGENIYTEYELFEKNSDESYPNHFSWEKISISEETDFTSDTTNNEDLAIKNATINIIIPQNISGDIYFSNKNTNSLLNVQNGESTLETSVNIYITVKSGQSDDEALRETMSSTYVYVLNEETLANLHDILEPYTLRNINTGFNTITGDFKNDNEGDLYLSLPAYSGFKAYLDGNEVDTQEYLSAISIHVNNPGEHHIELRYMTQGLIPGIIISLMSILLFIISIIIYKKKQKSMK